MTGLPALVGHPLVDVVRGPRVVSGSGRRLLALTALRADLLAAVAAAGGRVVLSGPSTQLLTEGLRDALVRSDGAWVVQDDRGGRWDGFTGVPVDEFGVQRADRPVEAFLAGERAGTLQVVVVASVRHPRDREVDFGGLVTAFCRRLHGQEPAAWGIHEPLERAWDPAEISGFLRGGHQDRRALIAGGPEAAVAGSVLVRRTRHGFEEVIEVRLDGGPHDPESRARAAAAARACLEELAAGRPLFAAVLARPGRRDLATAPVLQHPPTPLAVLIGPPGVRDLRLDLAGLEERFGAVPVGRPRVPSVLVPFDGRPEVWQVVSDLIDVFGRERVQAAFAGALPVLRAAGRG